MRILCVDDNREFLGTLSLGLNIQGHVVTTAANGAEGLARFRAEEGKFDAVITDLDMPVLDGLALISALRKDGYQGRIIVMSGKLDKSRLDCCCEQRVGGFFQKPFALSSLIALLNLSTAKPGNLQPYQ